MFRWTWDETFYLKEKEILRSFKDNEKILYRHLQRSTQKFEKKKSLILCSMKHAIIHSTLNTGKYNENSNNLNWVNILMMRIFVVKKWTESYVEQINTILKERKSSNLPILHREAGSPVRTRSTGSPGSAFDFDHLRSRLLWRQGVTSIDAVSAKTTPSEFLNQAIICNREIMFS